MTDRTCSHFKAATIDGVCMTCEREQQDSRGPLVSFAGGKKAWHNGPTVTESMRENVAHWKESGIDAEPVGRGRWI